MYLDTNKHAQPFSSRRFCTISGNTNPERSPQNDTLIPVLKPEHHLVQAIQTATIKTNSTHQVEIYTLKRLTAEEIIVLVRLCVGMMTNLLTLKSKLEVIPTTTLEKFNPTFRPNNTHHNYLPFF